MLPRPAGRTAELNDSILGAGVVIAGGIVKHSVLWRNVRINEGADVKDSILFDDVRVGADAKLQNCIIHKHVRVPAGEMIGFDLKNDRNRFTVSDSGIVVVPQLYRFIGNARRVLAIDSTEDPVKPITHPQAKSTTAE